MEVKVYDQNGKEVGKLKLPEKLFALPRNPELLHQVIEAERARGRRGTAHAKDRSEVQGGGKKPWRQKGTGRARAGSIRSPLWRGGGVTHGPRSERSFEQKINKKMRRKALFTALSQKLREGEILFLKALSLPEAKTKKGAEVLEKLSALKGFENLNSASSLVLLPKNDPATFRALRNLRKVETQEARNLNTSATLAHKFIVMPQESAEVLEKLFLE